MCVPRRLHRQLDYFVLDHYDYEIISVPSTEQSAAHSVGRLRSTPARDATKIDKSVLPPGTDHKALVEAIMAAVRYAITSLVGRTCNPRLRASWTRTTRGQMPSGAQPTRFSRRSRSMAFAP